MKRVLALYRRHLEQPRRERLFLASAGFFAAFGIVRLLAHAIRRRIGPFHDIAFGHTHVHHLVWGILILLVVGYGWLIELGKGRQPESHVLARSMAILYGVGAALTLDEFALWLHLEDVYWTRQGRASVDAALLFGALVSLGFWGGPFLRAVARESTRFSRRRKH